MSKQVQEAYICAATRLPIGKSGRGYYKNTRPDEMLARAIQAALAQVPGLDPKVIEDAIVGCSFPEGEQGMNIARVSAVLSGLPNTVGGVTVNRYCASGITALAMAADRIRVGESEVMIAGGVESMSMVPMGGNKPSLPAGHLRARREHRPGLRHGPDGREGGCAVEDQPRGTGRVLGGVPPPRRRSHAGRALRCRDDAFRADRAHAQSGRRLGEREEAHRQARRGGSP